MDSSSVSSPRAVPPKPSWGRLKTGALVLSLAIYGLLLARFVSAYAAGSDASGYLNNARMLRQGHFHVARYAVAGLREDALPAMAFVPLGFTPVGETEMVPTYPIGLPLLIVGVSAVTGWDHAPHVTMWLHGMMGVILCYLLARRFGLSELSATTGALLLGASPLYVFMSLQAMSDVPALVWCLGAIYSAWRSRSHAGWAVLAGAAVAVAVLIRPTDVLIIGPVALCLGASWRRWLALAAGGTPGVVFLALYNHALYGHAFTSGYGDMRWAFSPDNIGPSLKNYVTWLPVLLTPALVLLPVGIWAMLRCNRRMACVILLWMGLIIGLYTFYMFTYETWWYLRYILPVFPAIIVTLLFAGEAIARQWARRRRGIAAIVIMTGILTWDRYWVFKLHSLEPALSGGESAYREAAAWARSHLPANAVIFCAEVSGAFHYYANFCLVRWEQAGSRSLEKVAPAAAAAMRPIYAVLFPFEVAEALEREIPGHWTQVGASHHVTFWRFDGFEPRTKAISPWRNLYSLQDGSKEVTMRTDGGWFNPEQNFNHVWCWSGGTARLEIEVHPAVSKIGRIEFGTRSMAPGTLQVSQDGQMLWRGPVDRSRSPAALNFQITDGHAHLEFSSDVPFVRENPSTDARQLTFAIYDPKLLLLTPAQ